MTWAALWKLIGSDWTEFVPSLVVSLFTGLVVGIVLAVSQRRAERRQYRQRVLERWAPLRSRLTGFFATRLRADQFAVEMMQLRVQPPLWQQLLAEVQDVPLRTWAAETGDAEISDLADLLELGFQVRTETGVAQQLITGALAGAGLAARSGLTIPVIDRVLSRPRSWRSMGAMMSRRRTRRYWPLTIVRSRWPSGRRTSMSSSPAGTALRPVSCRRDQAGRSVRTVEQNR